MTGSPGSDGDDSRQIFAAAEFLTDRFGGQIAECTTAVILGSGLGQPADLASESGGRSCEYSEIPAFPATKVVGHHGRMVVDSSRRTIFLQGRAHFYEGYSLWGVTFGARLMAELGIANLVVTNAAGGITPLFRPGDLMLIDGHWTFLSLRLPDQKSVNRQCLWNTELRQTASAISTSLTVHQGIYAMMPGPCYETPAEVRMLAGFGIDAVGMSTIPESLAVASRGVRVLGVSCITNAACGLADGPLDHGEVSEVAGGIEDQFTDWLSDLLQAVA